MEHLVTSEQHGYGTDRGTCRSRLRCAIKDFGSGLRQLASNVTTGVEELQMNVEKPPSAGGTFWLLKLTSILSTAGAHVCNDMCVTENATPTRRVHACSIMYPCLPNHLDDAACDL
eukprot:29023-Chlamydomonas_euryale.AAC.15